MWLSRLDYNLVSCIEDTVECVLLHTCVLISRTIVSKLFAQSHHLLLANVDLVTDVMSVIRQQIPSRCLVIRVHFGQFSSVDVVALCLWVFYIKFFCLIDYMQIIEYVSDICTNVWLIRTLRNEEM